MTLRAAGLRRTRSVFFVEAHALEVWAQRALRLDTRTARSRRRHQVLERARPRQDIRVFNLALAVAAAAQDLLAVEVALWLDLRDQPVFGKFISVAHVPLCEEVVLDPDDLGERLYERDLAIHLEARMREDGLCEDVLDEGQRDADMYVLDVQRMCASLPDVHHAHFVEIFPVFPTQGCQHLHGYLLFRTFAKAYLHLAWVAAQLRQVRTQEHLPVQDLRRVLVEVHVDGAFVGRGPRLERARGDVVLEQLLVDDVDERWDQCLDVLLPGDQGFDVAWEV